MQNPYYRGMGRDPNENNVKSLRLSIMDSVFMCPSLHKKQRKQEGVLAKWVRVLLWYWTSFSITPIASDMAALAFKTSIANGSIKKYDFWGNGEEEGKVNGTRREKRGETDYHIPFFFFFFFQFINHLDCLDWKVFIQRSNKFGGKNFPSLIFDTLLFRALTKFGNRWPILTEENSQFNRLS